MNGVRSGCLIAAVIVGWTIVGLLLLIPLAAVLPSDLALAAGLLAGGTGAYVTLFGLRRPGSPKATKDPLRIALGELINPVDWIARGRETSGGGQYLAWLVGIGSAVAVGQLWVLALGLLPAGDNSSSALLIVEAPLGLCVVGAVVLARRSRSGSVLQNWAVGLAVGLVFLMLLYTGAG